MSDLISIEASLDAKRNAFSHHCSIVQGFKNYAVCMHLIAERRNGRLSNVYSDCSAAIGKKSCPAVNMRKQEVEKGQAIFFMERVRSEPVFANPEDFKKVEVSSYKAKRKTAKPVISEPVKSAIDQFLDGGAGIEDAINNSIQEKAEPVTAKKTEAPRIDHKPGESLAEMARRIMEQQKQSKETTAA